MAAVQPLTHLCKVTKQACDILAPMVVQFYSAINSDTSSLKADKSVFTIADGTVQHLLVEHFFAGNKFKGIVGEEECHVNLTTKPYTVDTLTIPDEFSSVVEHARDELTALAKTLPNHPLYQEMTVFIDPIDGTREFSTGKGEQCSILIGFADAEGKPQAGVAYRPITAPPTWASGAKLENFKDGRLNMVAKNQGEGKAGSGGGGGGRGGLLTSNGNISPFLVDLMEELSFSRVPSGGAGNKMLMLLEGRGQAYIQDRGVSRWDTCGPQACIEAYGGMLCKLANFTGDSGGGGGGSGGSSNGVPGTLESYNYVTSESNVDFVKGLSWLTAYNTRDKKDAPPKNEEKKKAMDCTLMQPYSNLSGLFAVGPDMCDEMEMKRLNDGCQRAKNKNSPSFD
jgi:3'-phosphoadenosine 5'-phosphosulfate (PAPS) 3'-phosphatase